MATAEAQRIRPFEGNRRFEFQGPLGRGGMGVVSAVLDRERGIRMALKGLVTPRPEDVLRFKGEFRALRDLKHPNLVSLGELFEEDGRWFFTMELVEGADFCSYARGRGDGTPTTTMSSSPAATSGDVSDPGDVTAEGSPDATSGARSLATAFSSGGFSHDAPPPFTRGFDERRLRGALVQLVLGLDAIHGAGMVHRDIKPSNILVEAGGRVVILDFGVVAELGALAAPRVDIEGEIVGTPAYMAPEQACGEEVGPAADYYAVGTLLYEALTGVLPFEGPPGAQLTAKALGRAPEYPADGALPEDLMSLCKGLLSTNPEARPDAAATLAALGVEDPGALLSRTRRGARTTFVGRERELSALRDLFERMGERGRTVFVQGPSGIGKSAMVSQALSALRAREGRTVLLRGRCHENEVVPFNAFDGVVDDLSRALRAHDVDAEVALTGLEIRALPSIFPTLRSVPEIAGAPEVTQTVATSPLELRRKAFVELRQLLAAFARQRPVVVAVDDAHWADAESLLLIEELTREPSLPGVLLLCTARPDAEGKPCAAFARARGDVTLFTLEGLAEGDAKRLLDELAVGLPAEKLREVEAILAEANGHPMFLDELLEYARSEPQAAAGSVHLDDALAARVARLDPAAQRALEVIVAAGVPLPERLIARAVKAPLPVLAMHLAVLGSARLVRSSGARLGNALEPYHDRVREAIYARLPVARRTSLHLRLGLLLERAGFPPDVLFSQFDRAGETARAVTHALAAARAAASSLAFERAAQLYAYAVRFGSFAPEEERRMRVAMAEMLQNAGRRRDSGEAYLAAADTGTPSSDERFELRRLGMEQLLTGGYVEAGTSVAHDVLAHVGATLVRHPLLLLLQLAWAFFRAHSHKLTWKLRRASDLSPAERTRVDLLWSLTVGYGIVDAVRGGIFSYSAAVEALRVGEPLRVARGLSAAAFYDATRGDGESARRMLAAADRAAADAGSDLARAYTDCARMVVHFCIESDPRRTLEAATRVQAAWAAGGRRPGWEADVALQFACWSLAWQGEYKTFAECVDEGVRSAQANGNRFREVQFRSAFGLRLLMTGDPVAAERDVKAAHALWLPGHKGFITPDYWALKSTCQIANYRGDGEEKSAELTAAWAAFDRSLLKHMPLLANEAMGIRGGFAVMRAARAKHRGDTRAMEDHLEVARKFLKHLGRTTTRFGQQSHRRLRAGIAWVERGRDALPLLLEIRTITESDGSRGSAAAMGLLIGAALGTEEGARLVEEGRAWMLSQGVADPVRFAHAEFQGFIHPAWTEGGDGGKRR